MEYFLHVAVLVLIYAILSISYNLLLGFSLLFSLAHAAMYGIGAYASTLLAMQMGLNIWLALLAAVLITAASGAIIGIPALRVKSHYLVVLSFGFQMVIYHLMMNMISFTGGEGGIPAIPKLTVLGMTLKSKWHFLIVIGIITVLIFLLAQRWGKSPFGRVLKAIRDDEDAARSIGKNIFSFRVTVFMLSGALAAVAGSLYAHYVGFINPFTFSLNESVFILAMVVFGGSANFYGSVFGALVLVSVPELLRFVRGFSEAIAGPFRQILYGLMLMAMMRFRSQGLIPEYKVPKSEPIDSLLSEKEGFPVKKPEDGITVSAPKQRHEFQTAAAKEDHDKRAVVMEARQLTKHFGGILAVNELSITLKEREITGLIGPNGAGKTTFFNLITGFYPPDTGKVLLRGEDVTPLPPHEKTRLGMARSFQELRLFLRMKVLDTVLVARPNQRGENFALAVWPLSSEERSHREKAVNYLEFVGLAHKQNELTENLSYAEWKLLSLARLLATEADLLLLDEPTSGLDPNSISSILDLIGRLPDQGKTICIVEHNLDVIRHVAHWVCFLAEGRMLSEGTPDDIFADKSLADIYFGGG
jgi:branched-chain amino acid transport system permease protein